MDDAPPSGRPAKVDSNHIKTLTENNEHYTMYKMADRLKVSKSIGEKEKCVSYFMGKKTHTDFLANPILKKSSIWTNDGNVLLFK